MKLWVRVRRLSCAIGVTLASAVCCAASQPSSAGAVPASLRDHLKNERLDAATSIRGLPLGVRDALQTLFGSQTLDIAEPGAPFQVTDEVVTLALYHREDENLARLMLDETERRTLDRLWDELEYVSQEALKVEVGCSGDHCLVYYERGGIAHTWQVALFHWTPAATRFEWGGGAQRGLGTIEDVKKAVLSGAVKGPNKNW